MLFQQLTAGLNTRIGGKAREIVADGELVLGLIIGALEHAPIHVHLGQRALERAAAHSGGPRLGPQSLDELSKGVIGFEG